MGIISSVYAQPGENTYSTDDVIDAAHLWLGDDDDAFRLFERFLRSTGIQNRCYTLSLQEVLSLESQIRRAELFVERGRPLAEAVIATTLQRAGLEAESIDSVIFTSCTSPIIPSLDAAILPSMGFRPTANRLPIYQFGCAGGVAGISVARRFAESGSKVLLVSLELCSLLFRPKERSPVHLLGAALFADGAAATVIEPGSNGLQILDAQSMLLPKTTHLMGYDIREDGHHLRLEKELPVVLQAHIESIVTEFLSRFSLTPQSVPWWLVHPGGMKILDGVRQLFDLQPEQYCWSEEILRFVGNISSATVLFVLANFLASKVSRADEPILMIGIGPGLSVELVLCA